jgi:hypothetical protein
MSKPAPASVLAQARPMPLAPPVTIATECSRAAAICRIHSTEDLEFISIEGERIVG